MSHRYHISLTSKQEKEKKNKRNMEMKKFNPTHIIGTTVEHEKR